MRRRVDQDAEGGSEPVVDKKSRAGSSMVIIVWTVVVVLAFIVGLKYFLSPPPGPVRRVGDPWTRHLDEATKRVYWFNSETGASRWEAAEAPHLPPLVKGSTPPPSQALSPAPTPAPTQPKAASAEVPRVTGWAKHLDETRNRHYWFNHDTGESSWTEPGAPTRGPTQPPSPPKAAPAVVTPVPVVTPAPSAAAKQPDSAVSALPTGWQEHWDEKSGKKYWFNHDTGASSWEAPNAQAAATTPPPPVAAAAAAAAAAAGASEAEDDFVVHPQKDMKVQDYGCEGSDSPEVCHWLVPSVAAAKAKCKEDHQCGAFVITHKPSDGSSHSVWLKMRDSRYGSSYAQIVEASLTPGPSVDTYVISYGRSSQPAVTQKLGTHAIAPVADSSEVTPLEAGRDAAAPAPPMPKLDLTMSEGTLFAHYPGKDFQAHDYNCQDSQVGQGCAMEVANVMEAEKKCNADDECGEFVIFHDASRSGKFTVWFKVKEYNDVVRSMKPNPALSTFVLKDMGPKPKFRAAFHSTLHKDFKEVTGADRGVWDGTGDWTGPPGAESIHEDKERIQVVRSAMKHAWDGYVKFAFGQDELKPVSNRGANWLGMGATIIDSLDTLWLMGLKNEFKRARTWVATSFNLNVNSLVSFFETTIRCLGGLITAFELSEDQMFLDKARILGDKLLKAFKPSASNYPLAQVNLNTAASEPPSWTSGSVILAEIGTVQLEFKALSRHTGDPKYHRKAHAVYNKLESITPPNGLCPLFLQPNTGNFASNQISLGAMGDSYYEYLIKLYLYTKRSEPQYLRMYQKSLKGILDKLIFQSSPSGLTYIAEMNNNSPVHKMDHLACFVPGMLAIGAKDSPDPSAVMRTARGIAETCYQMYARQKSGVAPEFINFGGNDFNNGANHNLLRPEALEAMFVMFRYTGDPIYREWGWQMFLGFEQSCRTGSGYSGLTDVTQTPGRAPKDDTQQSFFLAETLKYAFLLFADGDTIPLDQYVLNTEAHPLKMWDTKGAADPFSSQRSAQAAAAAPAKPAAPKPAAPPVQ